jgi:hypothetical protein
MSIKFDPDAESAKVQSYAIVAPRRSDIISGALATAFAAPTQDQDFAVLLAKIDRAAQACRYS